MMEPHQRLRALISGHVQGVSFRYYTLQKAERLELTGWVKNLPSGEVEVLAEGPRSALEQLLEFLRQGPRLAQVKNVQTHWEAASGEFKQFEVRV